MRKSSRGTTLVNFCGVSSASLMFRRERFFARSVARMKAFSVMSRRLKSRVNDALFFLIGPPMLPFHNRFLYGGSDEDWTYSGLRVLKCSLLNCTDAWPCNASPPGLVTISTRLLPG